MNKILESARVLVARGGDCFVGVECNDCPIRANLDDNTACSGTNYADQLQIAKDYLIEHADNADNADKPTEYNTYKHDQGKTDWSIIPYDLMKILLGINYGRNMPSNDMLWTRSFVGIMDYEDCPDMAIAIAIVRKVIEHGAKKYAPDSWKKLPNAKERYMSAYLRHIIDEDGIRLPKGHVDKDSGFPSFHHALCNLAFLIWFEIQPEQDNNGVWNTDPVMYMTINADGNVGI